MTSGFLSDAQGRPFATGAASYRDSKPGGRDRTAKVYVEFRLADTDRAFLGVVDTGAPYCILSSEVAAQLRPNLVSPIGSAKISSRFGGSHDGELYRHSMTLLASHGEALDIDTTLWVCSDWPGPCFLGYLGVLDRIRFALDPSANRFYFGPLGQT